MILGFATVVFAMSYQATYERAESELLGAAESLSQQLRNGTPVASLEIPDVFFHRFGKAPRDRAYWGVWNEAGSLVSSGGEVPETLSPIEKRPPFTGPKPFVTRATGRYLELFVSTDDRGLLLIGRPLAKEFDALARLSLRLLGISVLGFALATAIAWWITRSIATPISNFAATVQSITHQRLDERLDSTQPTLEMSKLASAFNEMLKALQDSFQRQQQFTSDAAHELRTPVSIVLSQSEFSLLRERTSDEYRQGLETCRQTAVHMKRLVDHLLEVCRIDSGQVDFEKVPLRLDSLAAEVIALMTPIAAEREVYIEQQMMPLSITGEATSVRQILFNLVANAIEFSPQGGKVIVAIDHDSEFARLKISDHGQGISAADLPLVWNRFYRADQARLRNESNGTGLGLSLVAELVKLHGGTYEIESSIGQGTTVQIRFQMPQRSDDC